MIKVPNARIYPWTVVIHFHHTTITWHKQTHVWVNCRKVKVRLMIIQLYCCFFFLSKFFQQIDSKYECRTSLSYANINVLKFINFFRIYKKIIYTFFTMVCSWCLIPLADIAVLQVLYICNLLLQINNLLITLYKNLFNKIFNFISRYTKVYTALRVVM